MKKIPYPDDFFNVVTAFDFIEHVPRIIYNPNRRFCFVELMNEIYRVLQPNGIFLSYTPAFPHDAVFRDPTHVNVITVETFPLYFDDKYKMAGMYGFRGNFEIVSQQWAANKINLVSVLRKKLILVRGEAKMNTVKVPNKSADLVSWAIKAKCKPLNSEVKTLTVDNGKEFADHQAVEQSLGTQTYFADPYYSWLRESNENIN